MAIPVVTTFRASSVAANKVEANYRETNKKRYYQLGHKINAMEIDLTVYDHKLNQKTTNHLHTKSEKEVNMKTQIAKLKQQQKGVAKKLSDDYESNRGDLMEHYRGIWYQRAKGADV